MLGRPRREAPGRATEATGISNGPAGSREAGRRVGRKSIEPPSIPSNPSREIFRCLADHGAKPQDEPRKPQGSATAQQGLAKPGEGWEGNRLSHLQFLLILRERSSDAWPTTARSPRTSHGSHRDQQRPSRVSRSRAKGGKEID